MSRANGPSRKTLRLPSMPVRLPTVPYSERFTRLPKSRYLNVGSGGSRLRELPFGAAQASSKFVQAFPQPVPNDFRCIGSRPGCELRNVTGVLHRDIECFFRKLCLFRENLLGISRGLEIARHRRRLSKCRLEDFALFVGNGFGARRRDLCRLFERIKVLPMHVDQFVDVNFRKVEVTPEFREHIEP